MQLAFNKKIKTASVFVAAGLLASVLGSSPAWAQNSNGIGPAGQDALDFLGKTAERGGLNPNSADPTDIIAMIINTVLGLVGIIFFAQMFYAGFRWMTSSGSEEIIKEAKQTIRTSIIGIAIIFGAFVLTNFVINRVQTINNTTGAPTATPTVPTGICRYGSPPNCTTPEQWTEVQNTAETYCQFLAVDAGCAAENSAWAQN